MKGLCGGSMATNAGYLPGRREFLARLANIRYVIGPQ